VTDLTHERIPAIERKTAIDSTEATRAIDAMLAEAAPGGVPGAVAAAADSGRLLYSGAAGWRDIVSESPMTTDTIVLIASMTKPITSVAAMQLVEQGLLDLDGTLAGYLPKFAGVQVLEGFDERDRPVLRSPKSPVTVRQLLTHTAGYVNEIWDADAVHFAELGYVRSRQLGGDGFLASPLAFDPGTSWRYSISTDVLGVLIEHASGLTLDRYFRERIFEPIGMKDTFFRAPEDRRQRMATVYTRRGGETLQPAPGSRPGNTFLSGGGGLMSTASDYVRFMQAMLRGGELDGARILRAETVDEMSRNQIGTITAPGPERSAMPDLSNDFPLVPDDINRFGFGFMIYGRDVPGGHSAGTLTWGGLYNTYFWIDRRQDICGVLMTQILPFYDAAVLKLLGRFERAVYAAFRS